MSIFIGSNAGDTITPDLVSANVIAIGGKKPSSGSDLILAGNGNDVVAGGGGDDIAFLGGGDDTFIWKSGDGSDIVDGGSGTDRLIFSGSSAAENITVSAGPLGLAQVTRNVGNVTMSLTSMERIDIAALDGQDRITVNDLSHTDVKDVFVNLAGAANPAAGDGFADAVAVNGTTAADVITVALNGASVLVSGLAARTTVDNSDVSDQLVISGGNGNDVITAGNGLASRILLTLDGGAGDDTLTGGDGADLLLGGDGNDVVNGGRGNDTAQLGAGDDTFIWNPGDGSDIVEGNAGNDTMLFNGANVSENIGISASGDHTRFTRDVANITMDLHGVERIDFKALGGADNIVIGDMTGTGVKQIHVDLGATGGGDDGAADVVSVAFTAGDDVIDFNVQPGAAVIGSLGGTQVFVDNMGVGDRFAIDGGAGNDSATANGTSGDDVISLVPDGTGIGVFAQGGQAISVTNIEHLLVKGGAGNDVITASNGLAALTQLTLDGGAGNDRLTGGDGADLLLGGDGNDVIIGGRGLDTAQLGAGDDTFVWNPGDGNDIIEGSAGNDTLQFNGSNASEDMALSANGSHAILTRNIANITMDLSGMEVVNIAALGGTDNIVIGDMTGTGVKQVNVDLAAFDGTDDGATDIVTAAGSAGDDAFAFTVPTAGPASVVGLGGDLIVVDHMGAGDRLVIDGGTGNDAVTANGTGGDDVIGIARDGTTNVAIFSGTGPVIDVTNVEQLLVQGGAGNDTITAQNGIGALTHLTIDGGAGNDIIRGGDGNDLLLGGDGNDFVDGNIGSDTADLGAGDDTFGWDPGDGSDVVEGGSGTDTLQFSGSNIGEDIALSANGSHAILTRNVAAITMDMHGMENVNIRTLGGADNVAIGDLTGTGIKQVHVDLGAFDGTDDNTADVVSVGFTAGDDVIDFNVQAGPAVITALGGTQVFVDHQGVGDHFVIDGAGGNDRVTAKGTGGDDVITLARDGTTSIGVFAEGGQVIDVTNVEQLLVQGGAGNDVIAAQNGIGALTHLTIDGGAGNDIIRGGDGNDLLLGGDGNDFVDGNIGSDTADLGAGDDTFGWDPGDGSDVVEGGTGTDTLQFNGSNIGEDIALSANGSHAILTRNVAAITMDMHGMENVNIRTLGGADNVTIGDMTGTGIKQVHVDLGAFDGTDDNTADVVSVAFSAGDDVIDFNVQAGPAVITALGGTQVFVDHQGVGDRFVIDGAGGNDSLTANGTAGDDVIGIARDSTNSIAVFAENGQPISLTNVEQLLVQGGAGNDTITAQNGIGALTHLTIDGGAGNDIIRGGDGNDLLLGGDGNDFVDGNIGSDTADLGAGDDTFGWDPGDGSDVVEGGTGTDTLQFNGSNIGEDIALSANGSHAILTRNVAAITMDMHGMENVNIRTLGGADNITIDDLRGTDVTHVGVDLSGFDGTADSQVDNVTVNGTSGDDAITLSMRDGALVVSGLKEEVVIKNFDPNDIIHIAGLGGNDVIDASALGVGGPKIALDGGEGDDVLLGGAGDDLLSGGEGDDVLLGGPGQDVLDGGPGDNVVIQNIVAPVHDFAADPQAAADHEPGVSAHVDHSLL